MSSSASSHRSVAALTIAFGLAGCEERLGPPLRPNVLLIVVDSLRADRLGSYGHDRDTSPAMDAGHGNENINAVAKLWD